MTEDLLATHRAFWDEWRGNDDNRPVFFIKRLWRFWGRSFDLHKMVAADDPKCFHSHPAYAIRIILWGGYIEQLKDGRHKLWMPGMFGLVRPELEHRIAYLIKDVSYSLWLRGKVRAKVKFGCD